MRCLDEEEVLAIASKRHPPSPVTIAHLGSCSTCRRLVALAVRPLDRDADRTVSKGPRAGELIAEHWVLEHRLGSGAMGEVWSAHALDATRAALPPRAAVKLPIHAAGAVLARLLRETRLVGVLDHPNIVRLHEVIASTPYGPVLVMELLDGETLEALLHHERTLDLGRACEIGIGIASALEHAHGKGIVHRDLKPANVMLAGEASRLRERVRLLDFGLARPEVWSASEPRLTATGDVLGTVATMAPEQVFGERQIDARADVWALGVLLYRMLSGVYPAPVTAPGELMKWLRQGTIRPIEACVKGLPLDVAAIVMQALEIRREERLTSPGLLLPVLQRHAFRD